MRKICFIIVCALALAPLSAFSACAKSARSSYNIECIYNEEDKTLSAAMTFDYYNSTGAEQSVLPFNLYPNAYRADAAYKCVSSLVSAKAYYAGKSYGGITINGVEGVLTYEIGGEDKNILYATLPSPVAAGGRAEITINFTVSLAKINHRLGVTQTTVALSDFFPILCAYSSGAFYECVYCSDGDPYFQEAADYTVKITMPDDYTAASSGALVSKKETIGQNTLSFYVEGARTFALVLSKGYSCSSAELDGVAVNYYYTADEKHEDTLSLILSALRYFSESFGPYVYSSYSVAQSSFCYGGMEYPALAVISDSLGFSGAVYSIVHETAHQWWYAMVGNNQCEYAWLDEGLAEYSTALFFDAYPQYGFSKDSAVSSARAAFRQFYSSYSQIFGQADTSMNRNLKSFISEYEYANIAYNKGILLFDAVYESVGRDRFFSALRTYYGEYLYKTAEPQGLIDCFKRVGADVQGLFDSFIDGDGVI